MSDDLRAQVDALTAQLAEARAELAALRPDAATSAHPAAMLQTLFEGAVDAMVLLTAAGTIVDINRAGAALCGQPREALRGRLFGELAARPAEVAAAWRDFLAVGDRTGEFELRRPDGSIRTTDYRVIANIRPGVHFARLH